MSVAATGKLSAGGSALITVLLTRNWRLELSKRQHLAASAGIAKQIFVSAPRKMSRWAGLAIVKGSSKSEATGDSELLTNESQSNFAFVWQNGDFLRPYGPDIAARARPVFVLSQDLLGLRNHILAIPLLGRGVEILGTAKWKLARTQKPRTRETAGSCDRDARRRRPRTAFCRPSRNPCRGPGKRLCPCSSPVTGSEERRAPPAQPCSTRPRPAGNARLSATGAPATLNLSDPWPEGCRHRETEAQSCEQETTARRNGGARSLEGNAASDVVKDNIRFGATNGAVTKEPSTLRKKEKFGHRETPCSKCCDSKTAGSAPAAKESTETPCAATATPPAPEGLGWRELRTETRKLCTAQLAVDTNRKVSGLLRTLQSQNRFLKVETDTSEIFNKININV
ncbi:uncharacterized protein [Chlorocebus sabaeus]|uniref:uncharacterized protein n=1 Tax=Chlorocebus sabaeus TaxID=60711 RepID=UPI003BF99694